VTPERFRRGLVVGKFAPLHRGHELVIRQAMAACEELVIVSYSKPELADCQAERREQWLEASFPAARRLVLTDDRLARLQLEGEFMTMPPNNAHASTHRRFVGFLCRRVLGVEVDAVFTSEDYGEGFAAELTADFREKGRGTLVHHVCVDEARRTVPVSGTLIRSDVHAHRQWLLPGVYRSFVRRICILGGESSGKSSLAASLAATLGTVHVSEYGRHRWEQRGGLLAYEDMLHIAQAQVAAEEDAEPHAREFLICDTSPLTTLFYSRHLFGRADPELERLAARPYELAVLCAPDFPFVQDGTREGSALRDRQHGWYASELAARGARWMLAEGSVAERVQRVRSRLAKSRWRVASGEWPVGRHPEGAPPFCHPEGAPPSCHPEER
jgi:HTH-type transcriptional regulator, transcriptional repressor of NAD biosynthesis genes